MRTSRQRKSIRIWTVRGLPTPTASFIHVHDFPYNINNGDGNEHEKNAEGDNYGGFAMRLREIANYGAYRGRDEKGLEASWAGKGVTVTAVNLEPAGTDKYAGTVSVKGGDWEEDVKITVEYKDEQITWNVDKWAMGK